MHCGRVLKIAPGRNELLDRWGDGDLGPVDLDAGPQHTARNGGGNPVRKKKVDLGVGFDRGNQRKKIKK